MLTTGRADYDLLTLGTGFTLMMRGRRLRQLDVSCLEDETGSSCDADFLHTASALPRELCIGRTLLSPRPLLLQLADGPAEVGTLRELELGVRDISVSTQSPLSCLTGLTHLVLHVRVTAKLEVESWPDVTGLKIPHVYQTCDLGVSLSRSSPG